MGLKEHYQNLTSIKQNLTLIPLLCAAFMICDALISFFIPHLLSCTIFALRHSELERVSHEIGLPKENSNTTPTTAAQLPVAYKVTR